MFRALFQSSVRDRRLMLWCLRPFLFATVVLAPHFAWAQPFGGCGNSVPPGMVTIDEEPANQPTSVTNTVAVGTAFEISHANRVAISSMLVTHLCVYIAPPVAAPPQYVTVYIAQGDFIDPVDGDREPGHTVIHQQSNVQITAPTTGGYQLIELLPGPVPITGPIVWLGVRYPQHNQQFVQGFGPIPPSMIQDGLAYVGIHRPVPLPFFSPLSGGDWTDYNYVQNGAGQFFLYGQRPAIRALELVFASGACCDAGGGCVDPVTQTNCTSSGGMFQGHSTFCLTDINGDGIDDACTPCCQPSGVCSLDDPSACMANGGTPQLGIAPSSCTPALCAGACCFSGGSCIDGQFALGCAASSGTFQGYGSTCAANPCPSPPCGNGILNAGEQCDDGNPLITDGCSDTCTVEPGWTCTGQPSVCTTVCGDGIVVGFEQCDDGNTVNGDGCSASCTCETNVVQFNPAVIHPTPSSPQAVTTADFNADGDEDVAAAHFDGTITFLTNNGVGSFSTYSQLLFGNQTLDLLAADMDADGDQDVVAAWAGGGGQLGVHFNDGSGGFGTYATGHNVGAPPRALAAADFDGDCDMDIATTNPWAPGDNVAVFLNTNGLFTTVNRTYYDADVNFQSPWDIAAGDMNGDGDIDLVVGNNVASTISVLHNNGAGSFTAFNNYASALGGYLYALTLGDWNGDGDLDVAVTGFDVNKLSVLFNTNGAGALGNTQTYTVGNISWDVIAADIDGDGDLDLALTNRNPPFQVQIMRNNGTGTFAAPVNLPFGPGSGPQALVAADFTGDGKRDLAVAFNGGGAVATLVNSGVHDCNQDCINDSAQPAGTMAFAVFGTSNALHCEWTISGGGFSCQGTLCEPTGAGGAAFADTFAESVNANCCPTIRATRVAGLPNGFRITAPDPTFTFCLGPPVFPTCCFPGAPSCSCNPDVVLLSGEDCNMNGEDDTIDLLSGISTDENGNHIPDECDVFGDVDGDADVDVDDILRVLGGFSDPEMFPEADIQPCGGNGIVDVDDILWILAAFAGENLCP